MVGHCEILFLYWVHFLAAKNLWSKLLQFIPNLYTKWQQKMLVGFSKPFDYQSQHVLLGRAAATPSSTLTVGHPGTVLVIHKCMHIAYAHTYRNTSVINAFIMYPSFPNFLLACFGSLKLCLPKIL